MLRWPEEGAGQLGPRLAIDRMAASARQRPGRDEGREFSWTAVNAWSSMTAVAASKRPPGTAPVPAAVQADHDHFSTWPRRVTGPASRDRARQTAEVRSTLITSGVKSAGPRRYHSHGYQRLASSAFQHNDGGPSGLDAGGSLASLSPVRV